MTLHFACRKLELQQAANQMEILFSNDFANMNLEQLKAVRDQYIEFKKSVDDLHWSNTQYNAWQYMEQRITEEENKNDSAKIGDIFHSSWGYDQTNTEYFKIVEISKTGKTCEVVQIGSETVKGSEGFMCDSITPTPEVILQGGKTCKVKIERAHATNPFNKKVVAIGEIQLRGSVFFSSSENKHLQTLYRVDPTKSEYRSWYA